MHASCGPVAPASAPSATTRGEDAAVAAAISSTRHGASTKRRSRSPSRPGAATMAAAAAGDASAANSRTRSTSKLVCGCVSRALNTKGNRCNRPARSIASSGRRRIRFSSCPVRMSSTPHASAAASRSCSQATLTPSNQSVSRSAATASSTPRSPPLLVARAGVCHAGALAMEAGRALRRTGVVKAAWPQHPTGSSSCPRKSSAAPPTAATMTSSGGTRYASSASTAAASPDAVL
mmetsp:Transcript_26672/g.85847  ORF Transcript_26672/g.85847 Transcript_26672/m.85847 type:complete len:235 (+) Transcript_26672:913-1617(+)